MNQKSRLDIALVERGFHASRARAGDAIRRGGVRVNGKPATKTGMAVGPADVIEVNDPAIGYVSRAALKLKAGLVATGFSAAGRTGLDLGASTGGFTQVLLEAGAAGVIAVDVGHGQMARQVAEDRRVTSLEGVNARNLSAHALRGMPIEFLVCDVSFISLKLALPASLDLAAPGAWGLFLVKPQFELGRDQIGKKGLVSSPVAVERCAREMSDWLDERAGWRAVYLNRSPISGGHGNSEFLLGGIKAR